MTKEQMEQIVLENMQKIYLFCVRRLGNATEAEDVASDVVLELLRSYAKVQNDDAVYGYIWAVAGNLCKNYWRRTKKHETTEIPEDYAGTYEITPEEAFIQQQDISMLRRELSLLGEKYREIMIAHCIRGESCEEIAKSMHMSVTNIKQYLFEGRKKVRKGMDMQREYGVYSYAPEKFTMNFWGDSCEGYWELFERRLPGSIMLAVYDSPRTMEELSMEVGVSVPYLEEEVAKLEEYRLLVKKGQKYHSGIVIYNKDFQEDKEAVYDAIDTAKLCIKAAGAMTATASFNEKRMLSAARKGFLNATDLADYLVRKGMPFRDAYRISGKVVKYCTEKDLILEDMLPEEYRNFSELFEEDLYDDIDILNCVKKRALPGGPAPEQVKIQISEMREKLGGRQG